MKGIKNLKILIASIACLFSVIALSPSAAQERQRQIYIVKSSDNAYFSETIESLVGLIQSAVRFNLTTVENIDLIGQSINKDDLVIALGHRAATALDGNSFKANIIYAYLTYQQVNQLNSSRKTLSILLDQPVERYLAFCSLFPGIQSVGVLNEATTSLPFDDASLQENSDVKLKQYKLNNSEPLLQTVRRLLDQNDALLMLPQQTFYNRSNLKGVLLTSYRHRKPVISYSPAHVKSGAMATIYSSPGDIGRHLADVSNDLLVNAEPFKPGFQYARYYSVMTNPQVARALGIELPTESDLMATLKGRIE